MPSEYPCQHGCLLCFISRETYECQRCCGYWLCAEHYGAYFGQSNDACDGDDGDHGDDDDDDGDADDDLEEGEEESDLEYDPRFPEDGTEYIYRDPQPDDDDDDDDDAADDDDAVECPEDKTTGCCSEPDAEAVPEEYCSEPEHEYDEHQDDDDDHDRDDDADCHE